MASSGDRSIILRLSAQQLSQPNLLAGLEAWQQLGLLSEQQIREFAAEYLICSTPDFSPVPASPVVSSPAASSPVASGFTDDFAAIAPSSPPPNPIPVPTRSASLVSRTLQSFMAEVSVIWLLFLGVFLVVVSSGVLAASQWQNFSIVGQYGILFAYTLAFAAAGLWTGQRSQLQLTARMLQIATLLIIPVNFWMMDGLKLGSSPAGVGLAAIAAVSLTAVNLFLLRPANGLVTGNRPGLTTVNAIGLSWLHFGWSLASVPLIATYIGTIGTALLTLRQFSRRRQDELAPVATFAAAPLIVALATLLLIGRSILAAGVAVSQLGLALGVCGWLICWMVQRDRLPTVWRWSGMALLLLGGLVSISADPPWQAIAVSLLALWLLLDRLTVQAQSSILVAIVLLGLGAYSLLWRLIPAGLRQGLIDWITLATGDRGMPLALVGLGIFPYLLLILGLAAWLRRSGLSSLATAPVPLAQQAEGLALVLGLALTALSLENPLLRSLNLTLSALTLIALFRKRSPTLPLLYLTHLTLLSAIVSWIDWRFPQWTELAWARVLLLGMAIEWGLSLGANYRRWRQSAWHVGLGLATVSYMLLFSRMGSAWVGFVFSLGFAGLKASYDHLIWLLTPILLTGLSRFGVAPTRRFTEPRLAATLSSVALIAQLFLLAQPKAWLISSSIALLLMLVNTPTLRSRSAALLTVGFGLGVQAWAIDVGWGDRLTASTFANLLVATLWLLWLLRTFLVRRQAEPQPNQRALSQLYANAANAWAIALCVLTLLYLMAYSLFDPSWAMALATAATTGAIAFRIWQQPTNLGFYGIAWGIELLAVFLVKLKGGDTEAVAIATMGLGLAAQIAGDLWVRRTQIPYRSSWQVIPLLYAAVGWATAHGVALEHGLTAGTGLYTLAAGLIGIGVGRRQAALKPLTTLSILAVSAGAYELLIYQLLQAKGGSPGDGITLLAGLAALIAAIDRLCDRWLRPYLRLTEAELRSIAHLHWLAGSGLALLTLFLEFSSSGRLIWVGVMALLTVYALSNGRDREPAQQREVWTYAGIWQGLFLLGRALDWTIPHKLLWGWAGAIATGVAIGLYFLPWHRWGWQLQPWRNTAIVLPVAIVVLTMEPITIQSLLIVAAFYAGLAYSTQQIRLSYLGVLLLDWAIVRYLLEHGSLTLLGVGLVLGGSLLYAAQIDPGLRSVPGRERRHWVRSLATGLICLTALYQAEVETGAGGFWVGLVAIGLGLVFVFLGLVLRVRAFLYIGTAVFVLRVFRLLWLFISTYSLLLWAVGIVLGLIFIWIAANFEARRSQMNALLQYWMTELAAWE